MDFFEVSFSVSGVELFVFVPPFVAFVVSIFTSMVGISGAAKSRPLNEQRADLDQRGSHAC